VARAVDRLASAFPAGVIGEEAGVGVDRVVLLEVAHEALRDVGRRDEVCAEAVRFLCALLIGTTGMTTLISFSSPWTK
jgi:hypothetical protein